MEIEIKTVCKHKKTGGSYRVINLGILQVSDEKLDMGQCVIYKKHPYQKNEQGSFEINDGTVWVRPVSEFVERFEKIK